MTQITIFIIRAVLGILFGILLARLFRPDASVAFVVGLSALLVALSYLSTFLRRFRK